MPSYVAYWKAMSKEAVRRGDEKPMAVGKSSPFSHLEDAERWLDAKIHDYDSDPAHVAEGVTCIGMITPMLVPPLIIRHCHGVLVLNRERCPNCGALVTNGAT